MAELRGDISFSYLKQFFLVVNWIWHNMTLTIINITVLYCRQWKTCLIIALVSYLYHTCEPSGRSIFLPILRVPSVPPVNFQNLPPVKKSIIKSWPTFSDQYFWKFPIWSSRADEKRREIRMVKVNVIFNDIRLLICFDTFTGKLGHGD